MGASIVLAVFAHLKIFHFLLLVRLKWLLLQKKSAQEKLFEVDSLENKSESNENIES